VRFIFQALFTLGFVASSQAAVWQVRHEWDADWEDKYAAWVKSEWNVNFFVESDSPAYRGLVLDCADAVYSMRAIFAREHALPFGFRDPSGGGGIISQAMTRFDTLASADQRMRAFLKYLFGVVSTRSLPHDTYPAAINRSAIRAGSLIATDAASHHSWTVNDITPQGVPVLAFASRPARSKMFYRKGFPTMGFVFPNGNTLASNGGFRNFRRLEDLNRPVTEVHGFSDEQYRIRLSRWVRTVQDGISRQNETKAERLQRLVEDACLGARERVTFVSEALEYRRRINGRCMNAAEFDDHSTPGRDARLKENFQELVDAYEDLGSNARNVNSDILKTARAIARQSEDPTGYCPVRFASGQSASLAEITRRMFQGDLSTNPNDDLADRWGEREGGLGSRGRACPRY
jgi:hypothetical protein